MVTGGGRVGDAASLRVWQSEAVEVPLGPPADPRFAIFATLTDVVVVVDELGNLTYANPFARTFLGYDGVELTGQSIVEFIQADDLVRAFEVMTLMIDDGLVVPVTPAVYRLVHADGSLWPVEINGSAIPSTDGTAEWLLIVGRYSGDRHLQERIVAMLTSGVAIADVVPLVPDFGHWRHPHEYYAVHYLDGDERLTVGSDLASEFVALAAGDAHSPWALAAARGGETLIATADLTDSLRARAETDALAACWAVAVPDPLHDEPAVLIAWSRDHGPAPSVHRYSLEVMAQSLRLILHWRAQVTELEQAARTDPLTGIANRVGFFELLQRRAAAAGAEGRDGTIAVLYVDLDGFKSVNDEHGHTVGDDVLAIVAQRISHALRTSDVVARLGGDEFAVLCRESASQTDVTGVADRITAAVSEPIEVDGHRIRIGASIGIASSPVEDVASNPDRLVDRADRALYRAKAAGRGRWYLAAE